MGRSLAELRVDEFLAALASGNATPGGGAAAALAGSAGAALVSMVCNLTIGRPKFADVEDRVRELLASAEAARERLQRGIDDDAAAYDAVMAATRLPKADEAQVQARTRALQDALREAVLPPLACIEDCGHVLDLSRQAVDLVNPNAISDVVVAANLAHAGMESAMENVEINLASIKDPAFVERTRRETRERLAAHTRSAEAVRRRARDRMG